MKLTTSLQGLTVFQTLAVPQASHTGLCRRQPSKAKEPVGGLWPLTGESRTGTWGSCAGYHCPHYIRHGVCLLPATPRPATAPVSHPRTMSAAGTWALAPPLETPPPAALLTAVFGPTGCFRWPEVASPVLGGCPHGGVQRQLRLIRERQRLVGSQSAWQCLHKFELSEPVGHPAPPGLCGRGGDRRQLQRPKNRPGDKGRTPYSFPLPRCQSTTAPFLSDHAAGQTLPQPFQRGRQTFRPPLSSGSMGMLQGCLAFEWGRGGRWLGRPRSLFTCMHTDASSRTSSVSVGTKNSV